MLTHRLLAALPSLEPEMLLIPRYVRDGDTCLDVGASYGTYTVALARRVGRSGRVHAFEPRPRSRAVLRAAASAAAPGNVAIHPIALADTPRRDVLVTPRRRSFLPVPGRSFLRADGDLAAGLEGFGGAAEREVVTDTLDRFVEAHVRGKVAFVKIDVEGGERAVIAGATRTLREHRPVVLCEIEDRHTRRYGHAADEVIAAFADEGYRAHTLAPGGGLVPTPRVVPEANNYLFLPA